ncbi:MAG: isocitrate/isopropylmalate family dehydrogenase [Actinomycetota bacterium]
MAAMHDVTLVPGDGGGDRAVRATRRVLDAIGAPIRWIEADAPRRAVAGDPAWNGLVAGIRGTGLALKGPLAARSPSRSGNVALRDALGLHASVRPIRSVPGIASRYEGVDLVVVRELTEGLYVGIEFPRGEPATVELAAWVSGATGRSLGEDVGLSLKANSVAASERVARFAFAWAQAHGRAKVTCGHKANIMKLSDGLFLDAARRVAAQHPAIAFDERIIDALSMQLVQAPERFDVLLLPNLFGDLVSDLCAGIVGGAGLVPSGNFGDDVAVFETSGAPGEGAGGTPVALLLAAGMLLRHVGDVDRAVALEAAVAAVLADTVIARLDAPSGR